MPKKDEKKLNKYNLQLFTNILCKGPQIKGVLHSA